MRGELLIKYCLSDRDWNRRSVQVCSTGRHSFVTLLRASLHAPADSSLSAAVALLTSYICLRSGHFLEALDAIYSVNCEDCSPENCPPNAAHCRESVCLLHMLAHEIAISPSILLESRLSAQRDTQLHQSECQPPVATADLQDTPRQDLLVSGVLMVLSDALKSLYLELSQFKQRSVKCQAVDDRSAPDNGKGAAAAPMGHETAEFFLEAIFQVRHLCHASLGRVER
jgi:hypothetical protein